MDGVIVLVEVERRVVLVLVVIGVKGFSEGIGVFVREGIVMDVFLIEIIVVFEVVWIEFLWVSTVSLVVEVVWFNGGIDVVVIVVDDIVEIFENIDVEEVFISVEGLGMVILVFLGIIIEVIVEILIGSEKIWVIGNMVVGERVVVGCGGKVLVNKDIIVLFVGIVVKLVFNIFVVEEFKGLGNVCVFLEVGDGVGFFLDGVFEF